MLALSLGLCLDKTHPADTADHHLHKKRIQDSAWRSRDRLNIPAECEGLLLTFDTACPRTHYHQLH